jgi:hypothetical protein
MRCPWLLAEMEVATILGKLFFFLSYRRYSKPLAPN